MRHSFLSQTERATKDLSTSFQRRYDKLQHRITEGVCRPLRVETPKIRSDFWRIHGILAVTQQTRISSFGVQFLLGQVGPYSARRLKRFHSSFQLHTNFICDEVAECPRPWNNVVCLEENTATRLWSCPCWTDRKRREFVTCSRAFDGQESGHFLSTVSECPWVYWRSTRPW